MEDEPDMAGRANEIHIKALRPLPVRMELWASDRLKTLKLVHGKMSC